MATKAYSYVRFSTPEQMKGDSYRRQVQLAETYAAAHGLELDTELTFRDLGVSAYRGRNAETGRLGDFLRAIDDGLVPEGSYLLVESLDRISRQAARKAFRVLEDIVDRGIVVVTLNDQRAYTKETLDSDPTSLLLALLTFIRANEESATKARRLKASWDHKRKLAPTKPMTSRVPAWLRLDETGNVTPIPERVAVVQRIFEMLAEGKGQHQTADILNREGVPTFGDGPKRTAEYWHRSYIAKISANPAVIGTLVPHELVDEDGKRVRKPLDPVEGYYPAVVDREVFEKVQAMRLQGTMPKVRIGQDGLLNMLAGVVKCSHCGATMTRITKGPKKGGLPKLVCVRAKAGKCDNKKRIPLHLAEQEIISARHLFAQMMPAMEDVTGRWQELSLRLVVTEHHISTVAELLIQERSDALRSKLRTLEDERDALKKAIRDLEERQAVASKSVAGRRLAELKSALEAEPVDKEKANSLLRQMFESIRFIDEWQETEFTWLGSEEVTHLPYGLHAFRWLSNELAKRAIELEEADG